MLDSQASANIPSMLLTHQYFARLLLRDGHVPEVGILRRDTCSGNVVFVNDLPCFAADRVDPHAKVTAGLQQAGWKSTGPWMNTHEAEEIDLVPHDWEDILYDMTRGVRQGIASAIELNLLIVYAARKLSIERIARATEMPEWQVRTIMDA